jgi:four helix bundle protein
MNKDELCGRTKRFALDIIILIDELPKTLSGRAVGGQLVRCATSVAANYRAACRSRSGNEFIAKIGVVEEEADESSFWLEIDNRECFRIFLIMAIGNRKLKIGNDLGGSKQ